MYCARCGSEISEDLNFCNKCGERVNKTEASESVKKQDSILDTLSVIAIVIGAGGMLFLVGLVAVLADKPIPINVLVVIIAMYLAAWFGVLYQLIRQISRVVDANLHDRKKPHDKTQQVAFLPPKTTAQLEEFREPASVTEPTTRTLDEIKIQRNA